MEQSPTLSVQEGNSTFITCTYTDGNSNYFPWYKQEPGKGPQLLIAIRSNKAKEEDQRLTVLLNKTAKRLSLHIANTEAGDSAVYFCAASTQCFPGIFYLYSNLWLGQPPSFGATFKYDKCYIFCLQVETDVLVIKNMWKKVIVTQSCPTLCYTMDYTVHGILQARILEWVAFPFSRGSSQRRDQTQVSHIAGRFFTSWATGEAQEYWNG